MLRYSNKSIFGVVETKPTFFLGNTQNVTDDVREFNTGLQSLLWGLISTAHQGVLFASFPSEMQLQVFREYMHLCSALLICHMYSAVIALMGLLDRFHNLLSGNEGEELSNPVAISGLRLMNSSMAQQTTHHHHHHHQHKEMIVIITELEL